MTDTSYKSTSDYSTPDFSSKAKALATPAQEAAAPSEQEKERPLFGHRFGIIDMAVIALCAACLIGIVLVDRAWARGALWLSASC